MFLEEEAEKAANRDALPGRREDAKFGDGIDGRLENETAVDTVSNSASCSSPT